ncbi:Metalloenzyme, LuxS/M16 peptidase-like protein [Mycena galericulata]|nr:Metalloenzyme, LuxS/M16 peptidase-like protein [Mycena galericulata]
MRRAGTALARRGHVLSRAPRRTLNQDLGPNSTLQLTTLPNKIRVATQSTPGHFSSVGLYIDAGSRYESPATSGASHFLDRMAFKTTTSRSNDEMAAAVHALGGQILCSSSRESIMYQSSHFHQATPQALSLIADTVLNPAFLPEEIEAQRDAAHYEVREICSKPEQILPEILHHVAYGGRGLGNPLLCPEERIDLINGHILQTCMKEWYRPERMVIAGAGMPHAELVELADKYFSRLKSPALGAPSPLARPIVPPPLSASTSPPSVVKSISRAASYLFPTTASDSPALIDTLRPSYVGGHRYIHDPSTEFNHLYVAFEGAGIHHDDIYALATMQVLLGGGGSFSAGGPGKGMYSRLYTHILNHYPQIDHCASFHHIYADSSLFGLFASFVPYAKGQRGGNTPSQILPHLVHQLSLLLYTPIPAAELDRAKNQLKSALMMALESRAVEVEDLGRQILVHNRKIPIEEMTAKIDLLKPADIRRAAEKVFGLESGGKATVVCMGHEDTGPWEEVFAKYSVASV